MTQGQKLRLFIGTILESNKSKLSVSQRMVLDDNNGGTYEPSNYKELLSEILTLESNKNWSELVAVYKKLPQAPKARELIFYLDGEECSKTTFMDMEHILGIRSIGGAEAPSEDTNTMWMSTGDRPDSDFAKGGLGEKNSIMKNSTSGSGRQGGFHSSDHEKM